MKPLIIGTRGSKLALSQTHQIMDKIKNAYPDQNIEICIIRTGGDKFPASPLDQMGMGVFVKEIETALLQKRIDLAVHSAKDLTPELPKGLTIGAIGSRQDPRDVLVNRWNSKLTDMPENAVIGTSSPRRMALIKRYRPDFKIVPIRGNIDKRLDQVYREKIDGTIMAAAGLIRLGLETSVSEYLPTNYFIPAPGQGALAIEIRTIDQHLKDLVRILDDPTTHLAIAAERAFLRLLKGGCTEPSAAYAQLDGDQLNMHAFIGATNGRDFFEAIKSGKSHEPTQVAKQVYQALLDLGAAHLLRDDSVK
ncbi:MAG: hydroxymethylbilane synthase [Dehalococcoidia bacterium]|nr:hydroxymethylbilane synthase [Dehalococcoidia bacterium]|tara:strand:+ start:1506 stop:2426 length:921 start_codon:yes stop_codon:yes gene_type:complete